MIRIEFVLNGFILKKVKKQEQNGEIIQKHLKEEKYQKKNGEMKFNLLEILILLN